MNSTERSLLLTMIKLACEKLVQVANRRQIGVLEMLSSMVAPEIIGFNAVKLGILLCGGFTNTDESKKKINVLIIGEPGLGKSTLLRRSVELVQNSRYESAENSSGKSLTAIVEKEDESRWYLGLDQSRDKRWHMHIK